MMRRRASSLLVSGLTAAVLAGGSLLLPAAAHAAPAAPAAKKAATTAAAAPLSAPVGGAFTDAKGGQGTLTGTFTPTSFSSPADGTVLANGTLTGTLTDSTGAALGTVSKAVSIPVEANTTGAAAVPNASCQILDLRLQPLDLNLLGLVVHLDTVHLNITAQSGPGNLLGNLLCAVVGLLNGNQLGTTLSNLLNEILGLLNGL